MRVKLEGAMRSLPQRLYCYVYHLRALHPKFETVWHFPKDLALIIWYYFSGFNQQQQQQGRYRDPFGQSGGQTGGFQWEYKSNVDPEDLFRQIFGEFSRYLFKFVLVFSFWSGPWGSCFKEYRNIITGLRLNPTWVYLESKSTRRTPSIRASKRAPTWYVSRLASRPL